VPRVGSFEILAEIATGIAGFGTIAIVLARDPLRWSSAEYFRTAALFLCSLGALFLALLPVGLATSGLPDRLLWQITSAVMAGSIVVFTVAMLRLRRKHLERALWFGRALTLTTSGTTVLNLVAQLLNVAGFPFEPNATCAFFGVVWFLLYGCLILVRIVFVPPGSRHREQDEGRGSPSDS
jgi:hypothetical protein